MPDANPTSELLPARQCPLCGQDNHCTGALASEPHQPCWCTSAHISRETIAQIPPDRLGTCICPQCAKTDLNESQLV